MFVICRFYLFLLASVFFLSSCAGGLDYRTLDNYMATNSCREAEGFLEEHRRSYGLNGRLLYLFDSAMVNLLCEQYGQSNRFLHKAGELAEELLTKSLTREMASYLVNDYTRAYGGEDFERAMINLLSAINYLMLTQPDDALVEFRRLDINLLSLNQKYETRNVYKEDAFGRYLSGIVYETAGQLDDAFIDYSKSYKIYRDYNRDYGTPTPAQLGEDLVRLAVKLGREEDLPGLLKGKKSQSYKMKNPGRIVALNFSGKSPVKVEDKISLHSPNGPITLAFPRYVKTRPACRDPLLSLRSSDGSVHSEKFELAEDINEIAVKNLQDRKARVIAKAIARAVVKQAVINSATDDKIVKTLFNIVNTVIEKADTRTWRTLPGEVYIRSIFVKPGEYEVSGSACGRYKKSLGEVNVLAGETSFFIYNTMY